MAKSGQLSSATITAALRRGDPIQLNDGGGLSLKITGKNRGAWYYRGRSATTGKPCLVTIGHIVSSDTNHPLNTFLSKARELRAEAVLLLKQGVTPAEEKRRIRDELRAKEREEKLTFRAVAMEWFESQTTANVERTRIGIRRRLENHVFPLIGNTPFSKVEFQDFKEIIRRVESKNEADLSHRVAGIINQVCRYARTCGYAKFNIADDLTTICKKRSIRDKKGFAAITDPEGVGRMLRSIKAYVESRRSSPQMNAALLLFPYTAQRA